MENEEKSSAKQTAETMDIADGENLGATNQSKEDTDDKQKVSDLNEAPTQK